MDPQTYCNHKAYQSGSSFYYSFLFLPKPQKEAMLALYAYCREIDDVVDEIKDPLVASKTLSWWHDETERLFQGSPQHPVTKALFVHLQSVAWPKSLFYDLLTGMSTDLQDPYFETFQDLERYCYCVAGSVGILSTYVFSFQNPSTLEYAKHLGTCLQLINIVRDLGEDLRRNRVYLPEEDLLHFKLSRHKLLNLEYSAKDLQPLLTLQANRAKNFFELAMRHLSSHDRKHQKAGLIMANIYLKLLQLLEQEKFEVLEKKIKLTPLKKLWIAWQTLRKEKKIL
ncbi:MAG TPA: presqualene diphosphate synthase HpnD [Gammaproteobacteria bacterium]|nr:presqualene diphosphate synthase HpnD [Gammaproteobacteria bacterium]